MVPGRRFVRAAPHAARASRHGGFGAAHLVNAQRDIRDILLNRVARSVREDGLWTAGASIVAAVSGGPDSLCLLGVLADMRDRRTDTMPQKLLVAHLDHGLRAESAAEAEWVQRFAGSLGVPCVVERVDVRALARHEHRSIEDAARVVRYTFLRRIARAEGAARICTGHTRDDQAETILMHLIRGSGVAGLAGMAPLARDLARPLLDITRSETEAYCEARGWQPLKDPSNASAEYTRNRIRHVVLPVLRQINPGIRETLSRNARLIAADTDYLEGEVTGAWREVAQQAHSDTVELDLARLQQLPLALRYRLYREALARIAPGRETIEAAHIVAIDRLVTHGRSGQALHLPAGLRVSREYVTLQVMRLSQPRERGAAGMGASVRLDIPGEVELPALGWRLRTYYATPDNVSVAASEDSRRAIVDARAVGHALTVRTWQAGDRFRPLGMAGEKKVQDFFTDAKVPRSERLRVPLVFSGQHLIWVAGYRVDDRVRVTKESQQLVILELESISTMPDETD